MTASLVVTKILFGHQLDFSVFGDISVLSKSAVSYGCRGFESVYRTLLANNSISYNQFLGMKGFTWWCKMSSWDIVL